MEASRREQVREWFSNAVSNLLWHGSLFGVFCLSPLTLAIGISLHKILWIPVAVCAVSAFTLYLFKGWHMIRPLAGIAAVIQVVLAACVAIWPYIASKQ